MSKTMTAKPTKTGKMPCHRCGGDGFWGAHIENGRKMGGVCYRCNGRGIDPTNKAWVFPADWTDEQITEFYAKRDAQAAVRFEKRQAKKEAEAIARREAKLADPTSEEARMASATYRQEFAKPNKFASTCFLCGEHVVAGEGVYHWGGVKCNEIASCKARQEAQESN